MSLFSREKAKPDFIDVHSHVSFKEYEHDRGAVLDRMRYANTHTITVGVDLESSKRAVEVANGHAEMYACIGLHPADNKKESFVREDYEDLAWNVDTVAVGECGLDYFRISLNDVDEIERQKKEFIKQIDFAVDVELPLMLHCRPTKGKMDAYLDVLDILEEKKEEYGDKLLGNVHFFVGDSQVAKRFISIGFTLSFTGVITFSDDFNDIVKNTPLSMIHVETDSPYATPAPNRGDRNEPVNVRKVVKRIAELRKEEPLKVQKQLIKNAYRVFKFAN
jgi:TatD DNase family protein